MADLQEAYRYSSAELHVIARKYEAKPGLEATARALRGLADGLAAQEAELRVREIEGQGKTVPYIDKESADRVYMFLKDNQGEIQNAADNGSAIARNIISTYRLAVSSTQDPAAFVFLQAAVEDWKTGKR